MYRILEVWVIFFFNCKFSVKGKLFLKSHWFTQKSYACINRIPAGREAGAGIGGVGQQELWGGGAGSALQALGAACYQILLTAWCILCKVERTVQMST